MIYESIIVTLSTKENIKSKEEISTYFFFANHNITRQFVIFRTWGKKSTIKFVDSKKLRVVRQAAKNVPKPAGF